MEYNTNNNFCNFEFTVFLLYEFKKAGINEFSIDQLETDLYHYINKYKNIFYDIKCDKYKVLLKDSIKQLVSCGYICIPIFNKKVVHILNIDTNIIGKIYNIEKIKNIKKLVNEYYVNKYVDFMTFEGNPDGTYSILNSFIDKKCIDWSLVTDASKINISSFLNIRDNICVKNHFDCNPFSTIRAGSMANVSIIGSSFVLSRQKINGIIKNVNLYINSYDNYSTEKFGSYALLETPSTLDIKVLKLSK